MSPPFHNIESNILYILETMDTEYSSLSILYEDDELVVINKPSGLLSIPDGYQPALPNLKEMLSRKYGQIFTVHRLDKNTSGAIIFSRSIKSHKLMNLQFQEKNVTKKYHAVVWNSPHWTMSFVAFPLRINGDRSHRTVLDFQNGKPALTKLNVLTCLNDRSIIEAQPYSGYTHQIRAHLRSIGHPIINDQLYGSNLSNINNEHSSRRIALHSYSLIFTHPIRLKIIEIIAPYPDDFYKYVNP